MGTLLINQISQKEVLGDEKDDVMGFGDEDEISKDNKRRICRVCKKVFGSGKALGGHMRIHVESRSKKEKSKPREEADVENCNNDELVPICKVCGKIFPSMKSLFGHMRSHPEREWRGILPPHLKSNDVKKAKKKASVPGWSVTAKRGRKPNAEEEEDEQFQDAVHHLMLLANGDSIESVVTGHDHTPEEELEKTNSNSLTSKAENEEFVSEELNRKKKKKKLRHLNSVHDCPASVAVTVTATATPERYECNTCGKSFATHQALGGHKSSHNKLRIVIENSNDSIIEEAAASSSKLLGDSKLSTTGGRIADFDLNELPSDHDNELAGNPEYFPFFSI